MLKPNTILVAISTLRSDYDVMEN